MTRFLSVIVLAVAAGSSHAASQFSGAAEPGPHGVGLRLVQQYDDSRAYRGGYIWGRVRTTSRPTSAF